MRARPLLVLFCSAAFALPARAGNLVKASLIAEPATAAPGVPFPVAVRLQVPPSWHVYWRNPGDSGLPPKLRWELGTGVTAGPIQWPAPRRLPQGPLAAFGLEGDVWLLVEMTPARGLAEGDRLRLWVDADWLVCQDECVPEKATLELTVPIGAKALPGPDASGFASARERLPRLLGWRARLGAERKKGQTLELQVRTGALPLPGASASFFPSDEGVIEAAADQPFKPTADGFTLTLTRFHRAKEWPAQLSGVVVVRGQGEADQVAAEIATAAPPAVLAGNLLPAGVALLFALLGGLLLNLMPCVLPVLGFKVMSFLRQAQDHPRRARVPALVFAAGVIVSFWLLAAVLVLLRSSGAEVGWGFQLQSPVVVSLLAFLFFVLGLSFLGFVEIGGSLQTAAGAVRLPAGLAGSFASGVLATAVATPCTAPFMGAALGAALVAPVWLGFAIFSMLGVGMALPYVVLSFWPALLRRVPRPGRWMEILQQALAFPLFGTVLWLLSVLAVQAGVGRVLLALAGLTCLAFSLWLRRVTSAPGTSLDARRAGSVFALALAVFAIAFNSRGPPHAGVGTAAPESSALGQVAWVDWSEQRLASLRAEGRPVFVDFTAAWCLTCQVNEQVVFSSQQVRDRFAALGVVPMRADWTRSDPQITRALAGFGRSSVPLNVIAGSGTPEVLPSVLTPGIVLEALDRLAERRP
jgi:thiol:disulfide interchange protein